MVAGLRIPKSTGLTYPYAAPEILDIMFEKRFNEDKDKPIDVYAYGMTMYEVVRQKIPWQGSSMNEMMRRVKSNERLPFEPASQFEDVQDVIQLIKKCWNQDPLQRPSFRAICDQIKK